MGITEALRQLVLLSAWPHVCSTPFRGIASLPLQLVAEHQNRM
jgi:hypothetical protein